MKYFEISRSLQVSSEQIFDAWTKAFHLEKWWAPRGFELEIIKLDLNIGGKFHYNMKTADGYQMWGRFIYTEIQKPHRLSFVNSFSNAGGKITQAPFSDDWPREIINELTLSELNGKTKITLKAAPVNAGELAIQTFEANFESLMLGFTGTFDRLEEHLLQTNNSVK
ncbi:MAG: SRPBCC domain-containing protein [Prolixibacteraceae bacterium]